MAVAITAVFGVASGARAQAGTTLTPDRQSFMVNKDIGDERWTITLTLAQIEPPVIASITGNVFRSDGGAPAFVVCQQRPDSTGSLSTPSSVFRLDCKGTDACPSNARECARSSWRPLAEDLQIPADFFLPPEGLGSLSAGASVPHRNGTATSAPPVAAPAQGTPRGATLTFDGLNFLVNKDVGTERWSISVNLIPTLTGSGGAVDRPLSITGNVFQSDGSPPAFVYCLPTESSTGTLDDPASEFQLACQGTSTCDTTADACAANDWTDLGQVNLAASFFLPPDGLPAAVQSDPEIIIIGRTSDPPAIGVADFSGDASIARVLGGACSEGSPCTVARIGSCQDVTGAQTRLDDGSCACVVDEVPAGCITCGAGASGSCGGSCEFEVSGATARGSCLPFAATSLGCVCYANDAEGTSDLESCAGVLDASCAGDRCCADDPRDGCSVAGGDYDCAGVCVDDDCVEAGECGICDLGAPGVCGDDVASGAEACDGTDLRGQSCVALGFAGGELTCTDACTLDDDGCLECLGEGESCTTSGQCCTGTCSDERCTGSATPTPTVTPTPTATPARTPGRTPTPSPTGELPCQPLPGQPCLESGFGECCGSNLACVFGPGSPPRRICSTIAECGNDIIEPGEECESVDDCNGKTEICDGCQCVTPAAVCGNQILEPGEECETSSDCGLLGPSMICDDCECVGGIPAAR